MTDEAPPVAEHVVYARPQIAVTQQDAVESIEIATVSIRDDYKGIEMNNVLIPYECAQEIIDAMQRVMDSLK